MQDYDASQDEIYFLVFKYLVYCILVHVISMSLSWFFVAYYRQPEPQDKSSKFGSKLIGKTWQKRLTWDLTVTSIIYCFAITYCYWRGAAPLFEVFLNNLRHGNLLLSSDAASVAARWTHSDFYATNGLSLHLATQIYETLIYPLIDKPAVFYGHHVAVCLALVPTLLMHRMHQWYCLLGICEATNVPLGFFTLMSAIPDLKQSVLFTINGALLWLSFTVCRLGLIIPLSAFYYEVNKWLTDTCHC